MKFLIDECLSPELAEEAERRDYIGSSHASRRKRAGTADRALMPYTN